MINKVSRGDFWLVRLDPTEGSEIKKTRPAVILSRTDFNVLSDTVTIVPISSGRFTPGWHVTLKGLKKPSHAVIPQIRAASKTRLIKKVGRISEAELQEIAFKLGFYLDLPNTK